MYQQLVEESDDSWLLGLVAFAIVEEQRIEWMRHFADTYQTPPTSSDISQWYEQQPANVLLRAKGTAENALALYAEDVLESVETSLRREISEDVIVQEIRMGRRFWPQFGINVTASTVGALVFSTALVLFALVAFTDISPVRLFVDLNNETNLGVNE